MASSWGGTAFQPDRSGLLDSMPVSGQLLATERHIVYSDDNIVDTGGFQADHYQHVIYLAAAAYASMKASRGAIASLIVNGVSWGNAQLLGFQEQGFIIEDGVTTYAVQVDFVLGAVAA